MISVTAHPAAPDGWDDWLQTVPGSEPAATQWWTAAAARHYPGASALWLVARREGRVAGALPAIRRRRRGVVRLESSLEGSPAGPVVDGALPPPVQAAVAAALIAAFADRVRGRTVAAVFTTAADGVAARVAAQDPGQWRREEVPTAVVDLRAGLAHVEAHVLTNNRRNERNRGLKRGCTLHASSEPDDLAAWYPLYRAAAAGWAQAAVPLGFMQDLAGARPDRAFLVHVRHDGAVIGGHFCVLWGGRLTALYGASRRDVARELFPATLLYWQDLVEGCARGATVLDFGGYAGQVGLRRFKHLMGTAEETRLQCTHERAAWRALAALRRRVRGRP